MQSCCASGIDQAVGCDTPAQHRRQRAPRQIGRVGGHRAGGLGHQRLFVPAHRVSHDAQLQRQLMKADIGLDALACQHVFERGQLALAQLALVLRLVLLE